MEIKKNKIVFVAVLAVIVIFIIAYSIFALGKDRDDSENIQRTTLPELKESDQKEYDSRLDAINDLEEVREKTPPSIYDERWIDSLGYYDPELGKKEKKRIVDSVLMAGKTSSNKDNDAYGNQIKNNLNTPSVKKTEDRRDKPMEKQEELKKIDEAHQMFFQSSLAKDETSFTDYTKAIPVIVDGEQTIMANARLRMRLQAEVTINDKIFPKNTPVYGFVTLQPNRVMIVVENINHYPIRLNAYDLEDGNEGIYVENNFRSEIQKEMNNSALDEVNLPGVPSFRKISMLFRRKNQKVKVTALNNYQLLLKPD